MCSFIPKGQRSRYRRGLTAGGPAFESLLVVVLVGGGGGAVLWAAFARSPASPWVLQTPLSLASTLD